MELLEMIQIKQLFKKLICGTIHLIIIGNTIILKYMQSNFANKEIVWAKVKGYPWWPAEVFNNQIQIAKLPTPDNNLFKVIFIAQDTQ